MKAITAGGTNLVTPVATGTVYLTTLAFNCINAGTGWSFTVQDRSVPPIVLFAVTPLTVSTQPVILLNLSAPIPMMGGLDIVTNGTPGHVNVWGNYSAN